MRWRRVLGWTTGVLVVAAGAAGFLAYRTVGQSQVVKEFVIQTVQKTPPAEVFHAKSFTLLILGCDEDLPPGGYKNPKGRQILKSSMRSDMMLVARVDFDSNTLTGVSIPRDTECQLPGYRTHKINAYHAMAKPGEEAELSRRAVEHLLPGVTIDRVVTVDYAAFQKLVNLAGGVRVDIDRRMKYTDRAGGLFIDFKPGKGQLLDGYQAMCFVRYRKGDSDFMRQERQKRFLVALKDAVLAHPGQLATVADQAVSVLGGGLDARELASLALFAKRLPSSSIKMGMVPVIPASGTNYRVDEAKLPETLREFGLEPKA